MTQTSQQKLDTSRGSVCVTLLQISIFALAGAVAFLLRFDFQIPSRYLYPLWLALSVWLPVYTLVFQLAGLNHRWWKYTTSHDLYSVARSTVCACILSSILIRLILRAHFPGSISLLDGILTLFLSSIARAMARSLAEPPRKARSAEKSKRILVYGAGSCGTLLVRELKANPALPYTICGLIDDQRSRKNTRVCGLPVLGAREDLEEVVEHYDVEEVLIAIPSASGSAITSILQACNQAGVAFRMVGGMMNREAGAGVMKQLRQVAVEDLLGRNPVHLEEAPIRARIGGQTILVTGGAGSIGSELCRQIVRFSPARVVCMDVAETALFFLERELRAKLPEVELSFEIGNVQNRPRVREVFRKHKPNVVYHAAAYKHVPLMEAHLFEAIENNVLGTYNVAAAADEFGADKLVLISTDKAVRPANVMGATKRMCELIVLNMRSETTEYVAVRFGNVLGSNGSVVPILKSQIEAGGPVTLTHPEMRRFFMTIPEASQLVLQASSLGMGGQIFVLDMGKPVAIRSLATNLILLSGLRPEIDIQISYVGMRPGEKLYEELTLADEQALDTVHPKIQVLCSGRRLDRSLVQLVDDLRTCCAARDREWALELIQEMVPEFVSGVKVTARASVIPA